MADSDPQQAIPTTRGQLLAKRTEFVQLKINLDKAWQQTEGKIQIIDELLAQLDGIEQPVKEAQG